MSELEKAIKANPDLRIMREAYKIALQSNYPQTKTGAVIYKPNMQNMIIAKASNKLMPSKLTPEEIYALKNKYDYAAHAERNAISLAARLGKSINGASMCSPWMPCAECCKSIIEGGIVELMVHKELNDISASADKVWGESQKAALDMFESSGVKVKSVSMHLGGDIPVHFKGQVYLL